MAPVARRPLLAGIALWPLVGCGPKPADERVRLASEGKGDLVVGVVWDDDAGLRRGASLARDEINAKGGVLGRTLRLAEAADTADGLGVARRFAADPAVIAVIGHTAPDSALPASITYEHAGILYINPGVPLRQINQHQFRTVFSTIPDEDQISRDLATFAATSGYRRIGVINSRDEWADQAARSVVKHAATLGTVIVTRRSFDPRRENFRELLADLGASPFDALVVAADERAATLLVRQCMEMNIGAPLLLASLLDVHAFRAAVGDGTPLVAIPVLFNPYEDRPQVRGFAEAFRARSGRTPDQWAAQGYDAVRILAVAMEQARSAVPLSVATTLRHTLSWRGVTGRHSFDRGGSVYTKVAEFVTLKAGRIDHHAYEGGVTQIGDATP